MAGLIEFAPRVCRLFPSVDETLGHKDNKRVFFDAVVAKDVHKMYEIATIDPGVLAETDSGNTVMDVVLEQDHENFCITAMRLGISLEVTDTRELHEIFEEKNWKAAKEYLRTQIQSLAPLKLSLVLIGVKV